MNRIYTFLPVAFVLLTAVVFSWFYGGTRTAALLPVIPWAWLFALEAMLCFPQCHHSESSYDARARAWRSLAHDPATYVALVLWILLAVPFLNQGLCRVCDYPKILAGADPDPLCPSFLPFCVNAYEHLSIILWIVPAFTAALAARHGLTWRGKRVLAECLVWNAAALAVLGFIQIGQHAPGPFWQKVPGLSGAAGSYFATFGYPNMAGCFFMTAFAVGVGIWELRWTTFEAERADLKSALQSSKSSKTRYLWVRGHYMLIPTLLCFFGAISTLSRAAILLTFVVTGFWFVYLFLAAFTRRRGADRVRQIKITVVALGGILLLIAATSVFAPESFSKEVASLRTDSLFERVSGDNQYHLRVGWRMFLDHPLFGTGCWGYRHFCLEYMTPAELKVMQTAGGANIHNDWLQLLTEHGIVGFGLIVAFVVLLILPLKHAWKKRAAVCRFNKKYSGPRPIFLYALPAPVMGTLVAALAAAAHALGDCPFRSPAVLTQVLLFLVCASGFATSEDSV